nr:hypothetical protein [Tanacetum cinerariifolium]
MLGQQPLAVWSIAADYLVSNRYPEQPLPGGAVGDDCLVTESSAVAPSQSSRPQMTKEVPVSSERWRCGKRRITDQHVPGHTSVAEAVGSSSAQAKGVSSLYIDIGDCQWSYERCNAKFWYDARVKGYSRDQQVTINAVEEEKFIWKNEVPHIILGNY